MGREDEQKDVKATGGQEVKKKEFKLYADFKAVKEEDGFIYVEGYASTFTEDLDGETVAPGAFDDTMSEYAKNPVILADHRNEIRSVVGKVVDAKIDNVGLWVKVQLSNAQDEFTKMVREKVQEGLLRAFSIGGVFEYDYPIIKRVKLLEISIVGIPANPNALFSLSKAWKGLDIEERKMQGSEPGPVGRPPIEEKAAEPEKKTVEASDFRAKFIEDYINLLTAKEELKHGLEQC
ncbi:HK97 family phage prohead protease [Paenactinomyces guangxiensis]|uniref:HK97 family phage prohead protease n=1 Tax=Paenactinomyces guangxiensis TaxID=1490290 RepID=A0A7W1WS85_9BACL|nr:HK97 family phage prohead protease [Paenactinomyces guangxiensis]MBA4495105.1 HK97 family phage prohead protease [Paenactinomyces guangxiensis]MBH8592211.1 HK97 family phage prohead protease [Paenactinomyces guangxiensis]